MSLVLEGREVGVFVLRHRGFYVQSILSHGFVGVWRCSERRDSFGGFLFKDDQDVHNVRVKADYVQQIGLC